jgi:tetratricopeptide (TPR) repeat protein
MAGSDFLKQEQYVQLCIMEGREVDATILDFSSPSYIALIGMHTIVINGENIVSDIEIDADLFVFDSLLAALHEAPNRENSNKLVRLAQNFPNNPWVRYYLAQSEMTAGNLIRAKIELYKILEINHSFYLAAEALLYLLDVNLEYSEIVNLHQAYLGSFKNVDWELFCIDAYINHGEYSMAEIMLNGIDVEHVDKDELISVIQYERYHNYSKVIDLLGAYDRQVISQTSHLYLAWSYYALSYTNEALDCLENCHNMFRNETTLREFFNLLILTGNHSKLYLYTELERNEFNYITLVYLAVIELYNDSNLSLEIKTQTASKYKVLVTDIDSVLKEISAE